jgi:hypothetical protein
VGRAIFGDAPSDAEILTRLRREASPCRLAGWRIDVLAEDWMRLQATSWFLAANLVVQGSGEQVALSTFISYHRWPAHLAWPRVPAIHRHLVPAGLHTAARSVSADQTSRQ